MELLIIVIIEPSHLFESASLLSVDEIVYGIYPM